MARALAAFLFGGDKRMLRFDLSEFKDYHAFERLVGDPHRPELPARLTDPVRTQPFQVILLDEIEKAHPNVWDMLLQVLDEGRLTPPGGNPVDFRNTILIATSNVGAREPSGAMGFGAGPDTAERRAAILRALEREFRPEFLNRFQHITVFHPLSRAHVRKIAMMELDRILRRDGIIDRNLIVDVDESALETAIDDGFDPKYGARALKREIQRTLVKPLALTLMERPVPAGTILRLVAKEGRVRVKPVDTPKSRAVQREQKPVRDARGDKQTRQSLAEEVGRMRARIEEIAVGMDEPGLTARRDALAKLRMAEDFWSDAENAVLVIRDLDLCEGWLDRLQRLRDAVDDLAARLSAADLRREIERASNRAVHLNEKIDVARRELALLGPAGIWDALLEISPMGENGYMARNLIHETVVKWADFRGMAVLRIREPLDDDEPVMLAVEGDYAFGYLALETGIHRLQADADGKSRAGAARVRIASWREHSETVVVTAHRALKRMGRYGGKIRSRLECGPELVLQNERTLSDNRDLAGRIAPSWREADPAPDTVVRRIQLASKFTLKDFLSDITTGKRDILAPEGFHGLLCRRIDRAAEKGENPMAALSGRS